MKYFVYWLFTAIILFPLDILAQRVFSKEEIKKIHPFQPSKKRFKYSKLKYTKERQRYIGSIIDTNAVYVHKFFDPDDNDTFYTFNRFFRNGEVYTSFAYSSLPNENDFNDFSYGKFGMYRIKNGKLVLEVYVNNSMTHFHYFFANVNEDKLKFYKLIIGKWLWSGARHTLNYKKVKMKANLYNYKTNWK